MRGWVSMISWQGGEKLHLEHLEESAPGVYETNEPVPVDGTWKAMVRLHSGDSLLGLPIYLPADRAIPAEGVPASASFDRAFVDETEILQRELKDDVPGYLALIAYLTVGSIVLALVVLLGWVLRRLGGAGGEPHRPGPAKSAWRRHPRGDRMSALLVAHAGHWLTTIGFALAPLTVIGGVVATGARRAPALGLAGARDQRCGHAAQISVTWR